MSDEFDEARSALLGLLEDFSRRPELLLHGSQEGLLMDAISAYREAFEAVGVAPRVEEREQAPEEEPPANEQTRKEEGAKVLGPLLVHEDAPAPRAEGISMATDVLVHDVADLVDVLSETSRTSYYDILSKLERWTNPSQLDRFAELSGDVRAELLHALVSWMRAFQDVVGAADRDRLAAKISHAFYRIREHEVRTRHPEVWVHGMRVDDTPTRGDGWRDDQLHWRDALQGRLTPPEVEAVSSGTPSKPVEQGPRVELPEVLLEFERAYPERLVVLPQAHESARQARDFRQPEAARMLLERLVTGFLDRFFEGGDEAARDVFTPSQYAARESETCESNDPARSLRTFEYGGEPVFFARHLKIGNGADTRSGWRAHFHVDTEAKCVVLGHCGRHLDVR